MLLYLCFLWVTVIKMFSLFDLGFERSLILAMINQQVLFIELNLFIRFQIKIWPQWSGSWPTDSNESYVFSLFLSVFK
jgi:hypothetical protein